MRASSKMARTVRGGILIPMYPPISPDMLPAFLVPVILVMVLWSTAWKALALWHSARRGDVVWFIVFLVVNTVGILEIIYLFFIAKRTLHNLFSK